ncbi:acyltransferase family protein [Auraticoccus monumenti]|uniref:Peptidoglycan/LPS O-acetylase OafA/YrhL, contains acyltransferase and SGNH-hydrolase domains n=1 Tax=Auraticoccus monumenti TaxID=675864 RepID=A0A1G6RGH7_9ACTN|nr:acyltransferase family protein [Auraticoccus monumenti]SDD03732.1 Peptidoglycan/LPS O-acetylase OafA/YrhL, contains acyltransferase and SGNH-hydrolase domains [Auraticoccus monumenti]
MTAEPTAADQTVPAHHRDDIQGLRAVAVLLVLAYHAGVPGVRGGFVGVDVFFVISGFLITGLVVREVERTGRLDLRRFYARRIRRLLPATAVVLVGTVVLTAVALPVTRWESVLRDVVASALYVVNWRLAAQSVDYLASEQASSPVQHFWSLAVEEQFYVVWPLVVIAVVALHRRLGWTLRRALAVGLALIAVPSLWWSAHHTASSPAQAYFVTTTRLWELAAGAFLVLVLHRLRGLPASLARGLGWLGLGGIAVSALVYTSATPFPGLAALLPVLSTVAVLAAGSRPHAGGAGGAGWFLTWRPMRQVGDLSYSLYLWHWPLVVVGTAVFAGEDGRLWWVVGVLLVCTSVVPAWLTHVVVERPVHGARQFLRGPVVLATLLTCTLVPVAGAVALQLDLDRRTERSAAVPAGEALGALALGEEPTTSPAGEAPARLGPTTPDVTRAVDDNSAVYTDGCHQDQEQTEPVSCTYGVPGAATKVALVGDSHAAQWQPALEAVAVARGWQLDTYTKSACSFFDVDVLIGDPAAPYTSCSGWNEEVSEVLTTGGYGIVFTSGSNRYTMQEDGGTLTGAAADEALARSYARSWTVLTDAGVDVVALANTPWVGIDVPECLAVNPSDPAGCAADRDEALTASGAEQAVAARLAPAAHLVDLNDWICPRATCSPVIGGVITFRDSHHLTATYSRSLSPFLDADLVRQGVVDG